MTGARSDEALYAELCAGDLTAFDRLYERHGRALYGFARAQLADDVEAEDVLHETFLAVLRARGTGTAVLNLRAWLYQVLRHLCLNRVRARKRADRALQAVAREPVAELGALADRAEAVDLGALAGAVERLPLPLADVYRLRARGLSYDEVATVLEVPIGTVKSRMHELVKRLREEVTR